MFSFGFHFCYMFTSVYVMVCFTNKYYDQLSFRFVHMYTCFIDDIRFLVSRIYFFIHIYFVSMKPGPV